MKFLLLAAFVAFCAASTVYRGKSISVNEDGIILITTVDGKKVEIIRPMVFNGQKSIDIVISGPNIPIKRIQIIDNFNSLYQSIIYPRFSVNSVNSVKIQGDILAEIFGEYQGIVDEPVFEKLLTKIEMAVKKGEINRQIYDVLVRIDQIDNVSVLNSIVSQNLGINSYPYGKNVVDNVVIPDVTGNGVMSDVVGNVVIPDVTGNVVIPDIVGNGVIPDVVGNGVISDVVGNSVIVGYGHNVVCKFGQCYEQTIVPRNPVSWFDSGIPKVFVVGDKQIPIQNGIYGNKVYGYGVRQNPIAGILRQQQMNNVMQRGVYRTIPVVANTVRGVIPGDTVLVKESMIKNQQIPYEQRQSVGNFVDMLRVQQQQGYGNVVGAVRRQQQMVQQPVVYQNDRVVVDNMVLPQVVY